MRVAAALGPAVCLIAAGCGGSSSAREEPDAQTLDALWRAPGEDVAVVPATADFGPGTVRYAFLVVDRAGRVVTRATARICVARGRTEKPFARTIARSGSIGVSGSREPSPGGSSTTR